MKHDDFIGQVQQRARLPSRGAAEQAKEQLPAEYERLFSAGSTGRMPG